MNNPRSDPRYTPTHAGSRRLSRAGQDTSPDDDSHLAVSLSQSIVHAQDLFHSALPIINDISRIVSRRYRLSVDTQDFQSEVRLHFMNRDYEVLRRFNHRSSLPAYVNAVVQHLAIDYLARERGGRVRTSPRAKELGLAAVLLEQYVVRDGLSSEEAIEMLRFNHGLAIHSALRAFCEDLAQRPPLRRMVPVDDASHVPSPGASPDAEIVRAEQDALRARTLAALERARQLLAPEERLLLKMHHESGMSVADIARARDLNQKRLYRTIDRLHARLQRSLAADGISQADVASLLADGTLTRNPNSDPPTPTGRPVRPASGKRAPWI